MRKFKIGIALGGGGVRGLAHIGILEVLEKHKIIPDIISGTSMGALVGAGYAAFSDATVVKKKLSDFFSCRAVKEIAIYFSKSISPRPFGRFMSMARQFFIMNRAIHRPSILTDDQVGKLFSELELPDSFDGLKIPFYAVATDLGLGDEKVFIKGDLKKSVIASASIAGIFPPLEIEGSYYLDGGTVNSVPVSSLLPHCDFVIGCDVRPVRKIIPKFKRGLEVLARTDAISSSKLSDLQIAQADFVIKPDVSGFHWANFKRMDDCIDLGRQAAENSLKYLKAAIRRRRMTTFLKRIVERSK